MMPCPPALPATLGGRLCHFLNFYRNVCYSMRLSVQCHFYPRSVMITNEQHPKTRRFFPTTRHAAQFLGCVSSSISVARNKKKSFKGWFVADVPASLQKTIIYGNVFAVNDDAAPAGGNRPSPTRKFLLSRDRPLVRAAILDGTLKPLRTSHMPEPESTCKPVVLTNMFDPTERYTFKSGTQAAFALDVSQATISKYRNEQADNFMGW